MQSQREKQPSPGRGILSERENAQAGEGVRRGQCWQPWERHRLSKDRPHLAGREEDQRSDSAGPSTQRQWRAGSRPRDSPLRTSVTGPKTLKHLCHLPTVSSPTRGHSPLLGLLRALRASSGSPWFSPYWGFKQARPQLPSQHFLAPGHSVSLQQRLGGFIMAHRIRTLGQEPGFVDPGPLSGSLVLTGS